MVTSAVENNKRRKAIRDTWGKDHFPSSSKKFQLIYLIGHTLNNTLQRELEDEHKQFEDIL